MSDRQMEVDQARDDMYRLCLDYVKGLTERRQSVSTTYLTVNGAVSAAIAFLFKDGQISGLIDQVSALTLLVAGLVASSLWRRLIRQYSTLMGWWYEQLRDLETAMPETSRPITNEYDKWYSERKGKAAVGMTQYEIGLTWVFTTIYGFFGLGLLVAITSTLA